MGYPLFLGHLDPQRPVVRPLFHFYVCQRQERKGYRGSGPGCQKAFLMGQLPPNPWFGGLDGSLPHLGSKGTGWGSNPKPIQATNQGEADMVD